MEIKVTSLNPKQREIAKQILSSPAKYHTIRASRQSGKTYLLGRVIMLFALSEELRNEKILVVAPIYEQTTALLDYLVDSETFSKFIAKSNLAKPSKLKMANGCTIVFKSTDRPQNIRGGSYKVVIVDEFAFIKQGSFESSIVPTTMSKKGSKIIVASTPFGKSNDFYKMYMNGKRNNKAYESYSMHYSDNPLYDTAEVEAAKLRLPVNVYLEEYEGEFTEGSGDVFPDLKDVAKLDLYPTEKEDCVAAIDWGSRTDSSVLTIMSLTGKVLKIVKLNGDWIAQIELMAAILNDYQPITYAESNGIGDPLITHLREKYSNVLEFLTTQESKAIFVEDLKFDISKQDIVLPSLTLCPDLHYQMSRFTYHRSSNGKISYHHRVGENDDYVDSLGIANWARRQHSLGFVIPITNDSGFYKGY